MFFLYLFLSIRFAKQISHFFFLLSIFASAFTSWFKKGWMTLQCQHSNRLFIWIFLHTQTMMTNVELDFWLYVINFFFLVCFARFFFSVFFAITFQMANILSIASVQQFPFVHLNYLWILVLLKFNCLIKLRIKSGPKTITTIEKWIVRMDDSTFGKIECGASVTHFNLK